MANLHAFTVQTPIVSQVHFASTQLALPLGADIEFANKWTYLVADKVNFKQKISFGIRITKPQPDKLMLWLEKIITSQQCKNLFVEQLSVDEMSFKRLKLLCIEYNVSLINIRLDDTNNNVIQGPW